MYAWECVSIICNVHGISCSPELLNKQFYVDKKNDIEIQIPKAAKALGLKCKVKKQHKPDFSRARLPMIVEHNEDGFCIVAQYRDGKLLVHSPKHQGSQVVEILDFSKSLTNRQFIFTRRNSFDDLKKEFNISWFVSAFSKYKKLIGEVVLASFFVQLLALTTPIFFQVVIDKVLTHHSLSTLNVIAIGMLVIITFDALITGLRNYQLAHTAHRIDVTLGSMLYKHLVSLPLAYFQSRQVGVTVARVHELRNIREFLTGSTLTLCLDIIFTIVFFAVMASYSMTLTIIVLVSLLPYIALSILVTPILRKRLDEQFRHGAKNQAFLVESISGIEVVKAMSVEPQMTRKWDDQLASFVTSTFKTQNLSNIAGQVSQWVSKITTLALLWVGAKLVMQGDLSVGQLIAFNMFAGQVNGPILRLVQLWQDFQQASLSVKRLGDILNTQPEPSLEVNKATLDNVRGDISIKGLSFHYQADMPPALRELSVDFFSGKQYGLVGRSGSGKSTLTKLLQRLYVPSGGQIFVDGVDLAQLSPSWLRRHIGVVQQETFLFNGSIRENIALAQPHAPLELVVSAAKLAGADQFISELPLGYDTPVGEQGSRLSGGQKQRIGIARALLTNPRILIFDEATSALDYESERIIQNNMASIAQGRTVIIVAHRLSTVRHCDEILVLDKGRLVEKGSHDALTRTGGTYAKLTALQMGEA